MSKIGDEFKSAKEELNAEFNTETKPVGALGWGVIVLAVAIISACIALVHL